MRRAAGLACALALLVSGCGDSPGYDAQAVEDYLASSQGFRFAGAGEVEGASCPEDRELEEGMTVRCTVTVAKAKVPFQVTLTDVHEDEVNVEAQPAGVIIPAARLRQVVQGSLDNDSRKAEVDCGNGAFVVADVGDTVDCTLKLGSQSKKFKVTVKDKSGTLSISA